MYYSFISSDRFHRFIIQVHGSDKVTIHGLVSPPGSPPPSIALLFSLFVSTVSRFFFTTDPDPFSTSSRYVFTSCVLTSIASSHFRCRALEIQRVFLSASSILHSHPSQPPTVVDPPISFDDNNSVCQTPLAYEFESGGEATHQLSETIAERGMNKTTTDQAVHLDLISKTRGITTAESYFINLPEQLKNHFTYGPLLNHYCKHQMTEKAESMFHGTAKFLFDYIIRFPKVASSWIRILLKRVLNDTIFDSSSDN
uniref:Uncharacterized protein n=1 Tax=Lactuca sativa TaxID=4236 RepID=A0A9R1WKB7_LACSA|nr:hypothetical protein LSAT_V11C100045180 [Lactuca sativa]